MTPNDTPKVVCLQKIAFPRHLHAADLHKRIADPTRVPIICGSAGRWIAMRCVNKDHTPLIDEEPVDSSRGCRRHEGRSSWEESVFRTIFGVGPRVANGSNDLCSCVGEVNLSRPMTRGTATISIVVPTLGRWQELDATLRQLRTSIETSDSYEIILVSDGGGPVELSESHDVTVLELPHRGAAAARNIGAKFATGRHLVFLDDDVMVCSAWWSAITKAVSEGVCALTGPVRAHDASWLSQARDMRYRKRYQGLICGDTVDFLAGGNSMVERTAFEEAGGFPDSGPGSDSALVPSLPVRPVFCWGLMVSHTNDRGVSAAVSAAFRSGLVDGVRGRPTGASATNLASRSAWVPSMINISLFIVRITGWAVGSLMKRSNEVAGSHWLWSALNANRC